MLPLSPTSYDPIVRRFLSLDIRYNLGVADIHLLSKVTAFITRASPTGRELLLIRHPYAGVQIPAGTVEPDETPEHAVLREAHEETGLTHFLPGHYLGCLDELRPEGSWVVRQQTPVHARPYLGSFEWAYFRRGLAVRELRQQAGFVQVTYEEWDHLLEPQFITYQITGWVPTLALCRGTRRHFYHLPVPGGELPQNWRQQADQHDFELFWAPLEAPPDIIYPQDEWLEYARQKLT